MRPSEPVPAIWREVEVVFLRDACAPAAKSGCDRAHCDAATCGEATCAGGRLCLSARECGFGTMPRRLHADAADDRDDGVDLDGCAFRNLISLSTPATGAGISASTLSVEISNRGSSFSTVSPAFLSHLVMVPSKIDSPICGMTTFGRRRCTEPSGAGLRCWSLSSG